MKTYLTILWLMLLAATPSWGKGAGSEAFSELNVISHCRDGINEILLTMDKFPHLFPARKAPLELLTNAEDRKRVNSIWHSFMDYFSLLEQFESHQAISSDPDTAEEKTMLLRNYALVTAYAAALKFIDRIEKNPALDVILDEISLSTSTTIKGAYSALKFKYLNVMIATQFVAYQTLAKIHGQTLPKDLLKSFKQDVSYIYRASVGVGSKMTFANAIKVMGDFTATSVFPIQQGVSSWFGDVKVKRQKEYLISEAQIAKHQAKFSPGDILLQRREWYLSNLGIPGFWTHAALYIGTTEERAAYFDTPEVLTWTKSLGAKDFNDLLAKSFPKQFQESLATSSKGKRLRIIEAIGNGVVLTALEDSAHCDSLAVLRPRLSNLDKAIALHRSFGYLGRPYDYKFDFLTDDALVCSELIYKSYLPGKIAKGLRFSSEYVAGSLMVTPNSIAENFSTEHQHKDPQMDMVLFLDGQEKQGTSRLGDLKEFLTSWQRPKWHILTQK